MDCRTVALGDPLSEDEPQAGAGEVAVQRLGDTTETLENSALVLGSNADACVRDADLGGRAIEALHLRADCKGDGLAGWRITPRVLQQDIEQALERNIVRFDPKLVLIESRE